MADGSVQFALGQIDALLKREWSLPSKINTSIGIWRNELQSIGAFLKKTDERGEQDHQIDVWARQVQEVAYDIQDVLDVFSETENTRNFVTRRRLLGCIDDRKDGIDSRLQNIMEAKRRYEPVAPQVSIPSPSARMSPADLHPRIAPLYLQEADVVGFEEDKDKLISWAIDRVEPYNVMFVVGMGGSGKTTLVKQVFEAVKADFNCHAWITVSKLKKLDVLRTLLDKLCDSSADQLTATPTHRRPIFPTAAHEVDLRDHINKLNNYLQDKKYLIVLDDLWIDHVWESIKFALPKTNSSRIIITTRRGDIANSRRDGSIDVHNIQYLSLEKAEKLLYGKAFPESEKCPPASNEWAKNILMRCQGLPLAITEIGQVLSTNENESGWKRLHDGLRSALKINGRLWNITAVLILSYIDLPYHLKCCFLFMNTFPPNYPIQRRKLIQLWIAEGFIKEENNGKELEDVGQDYLKELIDRSLVEVCDIDFDGRPRTCMVHNLMQEIVLSKLEDDNFCEVCLDKGRININESTRRISIHKMSDTDDSLGSLRPKLKVRTMLIFGSVTPYNYFSPIRYSSLESLKVLHLEGASLDIFPEGIEELLFLRYLCLRNTGITNVPKFIGKLRRLETLDLKKTHVTKLPKEICNLDKLRNLLVDRYDIDTVKGFEVEGDIEGLANLRKLSLVQAHRHQSIMHIHRHQSIIPALQKLKELRKLGIVDLHKEDGRILCQTIQQLKHLYSLNVTAIDGQILDMQEIKIPPPLQRLYLKGRLEMMPNWLSKLRGLVRLRLMWSRLKQSSNLIESLEDLPNLLELQLFDAYSGNLLEFNAGKFPKLKILEFGQLQQLKMVIMETNALPCLQKLIIRRCNQLTQIPVGIDKLVHLKELHLYDMPIDFLTMIRKNGHLVHHIPLIRAHAYISGQWVTEELF